MLLAEVLKHVVLPRIGFAATRFGAYKATAGCKRLMTLAVPFQICVRVEGAGWLHRHLFSCLRRTCVLEWKCQFVRCSLSGTVYLLQVACTVEGVITVATLMRLVSGMIAFDGTCYKAQGVTDVGLMYA
jgi:hypothetical protein